MLRLVGWCVVVSGLAVLIVYFAVPKVEVRPLSRLASIAPPTALWEVREQIAEAEEEGALPGQTAPEVRQSLSAYLERVKPENPFTGEAVKVEDSPGNLDVVEGGGKVEVRIFDRFGYPYPFEELRRGESPDAMP